MIAVLLIALFMGIMAESPKEQTIDFSMLAPPPQNEEAIVTRHIQFNLKGDLKLTTGELKLFTGFALNIIRHKCKNVDSHKLFQVQKYIGKRISDTGPVRGGQNKIFADLIATMSTCAKGEAPLPKILSAAPVEEKSKDSMSSMDSVISMLLNPFDITDKKAAKEEPKPVSKLPSILELPGKDYDEVDTVDPFMAVSPVAIPMVVGSEKKLESLGEKKEESIFDREYFDKDVITSPEPVEELPQDSVVNSIPLTVTTSSNESSFGGSFVSWIANIWSSMTDFFSRIFGMEERQKRDTANEDDKVSVIRVWMPRSTWNEGLPGTGTGRQAFSNLVDEICRIYCDSCSIRSMAQMNNFKLAARELLKFIFEDKTGIDLVANHVMDDSFINSLASCVPTRD